MKVVVTGLAAALLFALAATGQPAAAVGLKVAPLEYRATMQRGEVKKGFIDISNPATAGVSVAVSVQAFRQVDDSGGLEFYDDKQVSAAVTPELTALELGPREAVRLYFTINQALLPPGDVFAGLFLTTQPVKPQNGVGQLVRVGTLLSLVNADPGPRKAAITAMSLPALQFSDRISGSYRVKNISTEQSGFFPEVNVSSWPASKTARVQSSLVFSGRERSNDFSLDVGYGIHKVTAAYGDSTKSQWVVTVAPWMVIAAAFVTVVTATELLLLKRRRANSRRRSRSSL